MAASDNMTPKSTLDLHQQIIRLRDNVANLMDESSAQSVNDDEFHIDSKEALSDIGPPCHCKLFVTYLNKHFPDYKENTEMAFKEIQQTLDTYKTKLKENNGRLCEYEKDSETFTTKITNLETEIRLQNTRLKSHEKTIDEQNATIDRMKEDGDKLQQYEEKINELNDRIDRMTEDEGNLNTTLKQKNEEIEELQTEQKDKLNKMRMENLRESLASKQAIDSLRQEKNELEQENAILKGKNEENEKEMTKIKSNAEKELTEENDALKLKIGSQEEDLGKLKKSIQNFETETKQYQRRLDNKTKEYEELEKEVLALKDAQNEHIENNERLAKSPCLNCKDLKDTNIRLNGQLQALLKDKKQADQEHDALLTAQGEIEYRLNLLKDKEEQVRKLKETEKTLKQQNEAISESLKEKENIVLTLTVSVKKHEKKVDDAMQDLTKLKEENKTLLENLQRAEDVKDENIQLIENLKKKDKELKDCQKELRTLRNNSDVVKRERDSLRKNKEEIELKLHEFEEKQRLEEEKRENQRLEEERIRAEEEHKKKKIEEDRKREEKKQELKNKFGKKPKNNKKEASLPRRPSQDNGFAWMPNGQEEPFAPPPEPKTPKRQPPPPPPKPDMFRNDLPIILAPSTVFPDWWRQHQVPEGHANVTREQHQPQPQQQQQAKGTLPCPVCDQMFATERILNEHLTEYHDFN